MKRTAYITLLLLTLCTTSCEDYLGIKPRGYDVAEKIEHYEGLLYGTEMFLLNEVFPYMGFEFTIDQDGFTTAYSLMGAPETNAYLWKAFASLPPATMFFSWQGMSCSLPTSSANATSSLS